MATMTAQTTSRSPGILAILKDTLAAWQKDQIPRYAAALSYFSVFSIAPLIIITIALVGFFLGGHGHHQYVKDQILGQLRTGIGAGGAQTVDQLVSAAYQPKASLIASIVSFGAFLFGASGVFVNLQDSLNVIWDVKPKKKSLWQTIRERLLSLGMVLSIGFLLLVSFVVNAAVSFVQTYLTHLLPFPGMGVIIQIGNQLISVGMIALMFALIYKYLPDAKVRWQDVRVGAVVTAVLFVAGQFLIGLYLGKGAVGSTYGAAGALLVLLLWVFYSAQLFFFGAEFTRVWAEHHGGHISETGASKISAPA